MSKETLQEWQEKDETLQELIKSAREGSDEYVWDGLLYHKLKPELSLSGEILLVLPQRYRLIVIQMAHDIPLAGHLGIRKTILMIKERYLWPGMD